MPQKETKDLTKKQVIANIIKHIQKECNKTKDAPGIILIPAYRNTEQLYDMTEVSQPMGLFSNVTDVHLLQLAISTALEQFAKSPTAKKIKVDGDVDCDNVQEQVALILASMLSAALKDVKDVAKHLSLLCVNALDKTDIDREITFAMLPSDCEKGFDSASNNSGMLATAEPSKQMHLFATMILAYCIRHDVDIERFMNDIFRTVMTAGVSIRPKDD